MFCVNHAHPGYLGGCGTGFPAQGSSTVTHCLGESRRSASPTLALGLTFIVAALLLCVSAVHAQTAGRIKAVEGTTQLRSFDQTEFTPVTEGNPINVGDVVETAQESKCYIRLIDGSDNSLGELSSYNVNDLEQSDGATLFNGWLDKGIARFRKKLPATSPPSSYVITTPTAVIMVDPGDELTDFIVTILNPGQTYVAVLRGVITVKNISEDIPDQQKVRACQGVYINQEEPPTKPHRVSSDEYQRLIGLTTIPGTLPEDVPTCEAEPAPEPGPEPLPVCPCPPGFAEDPNTRDCLPCAECAYYDPATCTCNCCPDGQVWDAFLGGCTPICSSLTPVPLAPVASPGSLPEEGCPCCDCCPVDAVAPCYAANPGPGPNTCPPPGPNQQVPCAICTNPDINVLPGDISGLPCPLCCECDAFGCGINLLPAPDNGPDLLGCGFPDGGWCISEGECAARAGLWRQRTPIPGWPCFMCIPNIPCWTLNPPLWRDGLTRMAQSKRLDPSNDPFPGFFFSARIRPAVAILNVSIADADVSFGRAGGHTGAAVAVADLDNGTKLAQAGGGKGFKAGCLKAAKMLACPPCSRPTYKRGRLECVPVRDGTPCFEGGVCKECKGGKCVDLPPCPEGKVRRVTTRPRSKPPAAEPSPDKTQVQAPKGKAGKSRRAYLGYSCECVEVRESCKTHGECKDKLKNPNACCIKGECILKDCPPGHDLDPDTCRCIPPAPPPPPPPPPPPSRCRSHYECKELLQNEHACCNRGTGECFIQDCPRGHRLDHETCACVPPPPPPPPSRCRSHQECKAFLQDEHACCDERTGQCFHKDCPPGNHLDPVTCRCIPEVPTCGSDSDCRRFGRNLCCDKATRQCRPMIRCPDGHLRCECREEVCQSHSECMRKTRGRFPCCIDGKCGPKLRCRGGPPSCDCKDGGCPPDNTRKISQCRSQRGTPELDHRGCFVRCKPREVDKCPPDNARKISQCRSQRGTPELDHRGCLVRCKPRDVDKCPPDNARKISQCRSQRGTPETDHRGCLVRCKPRDVDKCPPDNARKISQCRSQRGTPELDHRGCLVRCKPGDVDKCPPDNARKISQCKSQRGTPELDHRGCLVRCKPRDVDKCPPDNARKISQCRSQRGTPELGHRGCLVRCKPREVDKCPPDNARKISQCRSQRGTPETDHRGCLVRCKLREVDKCPPDNARKISQCRSQRGVADLDHRGCFVRCRHGGGSGGDPCAQCKAKGMDCEQLGHGKVRCKPRARR